MTLQEQIKPLAECCKQISDNVNFLRNSVNAMRNDMVTYERNIINRIESMQSIGTCKFCFSKIPCNHTNS